jgi:hypothetical protein
MATSRNEGQDYRLLRVEAVRKSLQKLIDAKIHQHFAGYLAILRTAAIEGRNSDLVPDYKGFYNDFFLAEGLPAKRPYVVPFKGNSTKKPPLQNKNVAGSYAPSSLRGVAPLLSLVSIDSSGKGAADRYSLKNDHAVKALGLLLRNTPLPVLELAIFLYRNYGFTEDSASADGLVTTFRSDFGLGQEGPQSTFATLFDPVITIAQPFQS